MQEDADAVGLSLHNASHMTLAPRMVDALRAAGVDIPVIVGGIIPDDDVQPLRDAGVAAILGPGASATDVAAAVRDAVATHAAEQGQPSEPSYSPISWRDRRGRALRCSRRRPPAGGR